MEGKLGTLVRGVVRTLQEMTPEDRFRIVVFNDNARRLVPGFLPATPENVKRATALVEGLVADGSTNLYDGLRLGLADLDDDRAQSVVLVTDAVTNTGMLDPVAFHQLMKKVDVRAFGFLLGNSANWPLMEAICEASGGFWAQVSNADDILGQLMLAKSKVTHECLHDADLRISGVKTHDVTDGALGKVYRGQQLVLFGRYDEAGEATVTLKARLTGEDKAYRTTFSFPEADTENPELERLWALHRIEAIEAEELLGKRAAVEAEQAVRDLGVAYQIVTDHTAMVVLSDEVFTGRGIERKNLARVARERKAQAVRAAQAARNRRVDTDRPVFGGKAPRVGGGALDPFTVALVLGLAGAAVALGRRRRRP
jgi:Ca-activated chloride channel family protein